MCLFSVSMCTCVQVLKDACGILFPWGWSYRGLWVAQWWGGGLGTEFQSSGREVCTLDPWATFSASVFSMCVSMWVCATGVQVPAEAGGRVRPSGARVKTAVCCLALLLGTELGPLKSSNYSNCWVLSPATPPYIDFLWRQEFYCVSEDLELLILLPLLLKCCDYRHARTLC